MADYGLGSWPARRARIDPDGVALRQGTAAGERAAGRADSSLFAPQASLTQSVTFGDLARRVDALAGAFAGQGVGAGDRVAYLGPNDIATFEVLFAALRLGAIFAPYNTRLTAPEISYLIEDSAPRVLVYAPESGAVVQDSDTADVGTVVSLGAELDRLRSSGSGVPSGIEVGLDDDAVILYTSGTTGRPKGAVLTHGNLTFNTMNQLAHVDVLSSDTALCMCPLFHATGLGQVGLPTLFKGGTVVVVPSFEAGTVLRTIAEQRITAFPAVPTMLQMLCDHEGFADADLTSLRYVIYGGSAVAERVALAWHRRGVRILQGYGMTEASPGVYLAAPDGAADRPTSIGVPHFFTDVAHEPDATAPEPGEAGELLVRGPNVFSRYWQRPDDTERAFVDGWYRSGDVVRVDPDGWAYVVDRTTDLIISGGENVYPSEVEAAIDALPGVVESSVLAVPDERWGEVGLAAVVASDPGWTEESLRAALGDVLAGFKIPRYVRFVDGLPRTATGKVQKAEVRTRLGG